MTFKSALQRMMGHICSGLEAMNSGLPNKSRGMRSSTVTVRHVSRMKSFTRYFPDGDTVGAPLV